MSQVQTSGRHYRGVSEEQRQRERRNKLIESGIVMFGDHGYQNSTVKAVCLEAGLTERYFYESFANRDEFFISVYEHESRKLRTAILTAVSEHEEPASMVRSGLKKFFTMLREDPRLSRILLVEATRVGGAMDAVWRETMAGFAEDMRMLAPVFLADTDPAGYDIDLLAAGMVGVTLNISMTWFLAGFDKPVTRVVEHCFMQFEAVRMYLRHEAGGGGAAKGRKNKTR
jgi:AcrR family transcriptional regulator